MKARSRLRPVDVLLTGTAGLMARRLRAAFSALGICIGIAAIVGVLGVTQSSQADLLAQIDRIGTNLVTVEKGQGLGGSEGPLPLTAPSMIGILPGVQRISSTAALPGGVYRTDRVPAFETGGIGLRATDSSLLQTLNGRLLAGAFINGATSRYPVAVLGYSAAQALGISGLDQPGPDLGRRPVADRRGHPRACRAGARDRPLGPGRPGLRRVVAWLRRISHPPLRAGRPRPGDRDHERAGAHHQPPKP